VTEAVLPFPNSASESGRVDELTALYRLTDRLYRALSVQEVYDAALDAIMEALGCSRASILLFDDSGVMSFVAWRGLSDAYRAAVNGHSPWMPGDKDPQPIFVEDIDRTDEPEWLKETIKREDIRAAAFIPLVAQGVVIGKFMAYYKTPHTFAENEVEIAIAIARQVGFSLERARAEQSRKIAEEELRLSEERFREMSEDAPVMIWRSDAQGRCLHLNSMLRSFWNVDEESLAEFDWQTMMHPDDAPEIGRRMMDAIARRSGVVTQGRYLNADGEFRVLQTKARPHFSAKGEFQGMIGVNVDITERVLSEKALRQSEERFRLAVEAAPSGMVMTDSTGRIVLVNAQAEELFGYPREELVGEHVDILVPDRLREPRQSPLRAYGDPPTARPTGAGPEFLVLRKDGREVPVEIGLSPIETPDGMMALAAVVDISERKRADAQRDLLLAELNHRVKNTLAVVQGIAHQTFKGTDALQARAAFEERLVALAAAHNLLTQANFESASLEQLATEALQSRGGNEHRFSVSGPRILLRPKEALAIAMALHELSTNAVKYGALSNDVGQILLNWKVSGDAQPRLTMVWEERGGPQVAAPKRQGFGSRLVSRSLAQELNAQVILDFKPEGLVCSIDAPLTGAIPQ
jgi:PAS domain S-box-containing protein